MCIETLDGRNEDFRISLLKMNGIQTDYGSGKKYGVELNGFLLFKTDDLEEARQRYDIAMVGFKEFLEKVKTVLQS